MSKQFSIKDRLKSFPFAINGIISTFKSQHNFIIHLCMAIIAIAMGHFLNISPLEWVAITVVITMVLTAELINTSIEGIVDLISPEKNKIAGKVKDAAAGAVLISAIGSLITGLIIFLPKLLSIL